MANPLSFLLGTLSGIRGAFARYLKGVFPLPSVASLASRLRAGLSPLSIADAIIGAEKLLSARRVGLAMSGPQIGQIGSGLIIPSAPLLDIPQARPGDVVADVFVEASTTDPTGQNHVTRASQIIVVDSQLPPFEWDSVVEVAMRESGYSASLGLMVSISTQYNWVFQIDTSSL